MIYVVLVIYFVVLASIGLIASRRVDDLGDFFVGGKKLGYWVVAFSARATGESAWLLLGLTGLGAMVGVSALWVVVGEVAGVSIAWLLMAEPFKKETDHYKSITVPDYLVSKFGTSPSSGRKIRIIAAGILALFVTIYVSAQIDATGKAFESFLNWNYYTGIVAGFGIVVLYTYFGGFVAVSWSDLLQGSLMLIGLVAVPVVAVTQIHSGADFFGSLADHDHGFLNIFGSGGLTLTNACIIVSYLAVGLGFLGSPQVFVRFMSLKDVGEIRFGRWVAIVYTILTDTGAVLTGIFGRYLLVAPAEDVESVLGVGAESVLPDIVAFLFPTLLVGVFIAAVLAAIMSTIDSLLVVASSAATRDYYQQTFNPDLPDNSLTKLSRRVTLVLAAIALGIAITVSIVSPDRTIFWFVIFGWSGIACAFCPAIILSLFWGKYTATGVIASMLAGLVGVPFFKFGAPLLPVVGPYFELAGEMLPAFLLSLICGIIASGRRR